jgi:energy-coupling factor transporter ATP-binding protein EcfA2
VHTHPDSEVDPQPDLAAYVDAAVASGIDVLAITDHNSVLFVRDALRAAEDKPLVVIPGIEISTRDGHQLALFAPEAVESLESLATAESLKLKTLSPTERRSERSILDLVEEIAGRGGLAIPAHVDLPSGICAALRQSELVDLLSTPALAGLEFATEETLRTWFTDEDEDSDRLAAWGARQSVPELKERGLARLMSSDSHRPESVGRDRGSRTLTRLRLDDPNFSAIRNAIQLNPKARCKAEAILPAVYPRILRAEFEGGFLDGVAINFSDNLNCLIGGRGSGKSTALLSIRAALGAPSSPDEDPDEGDRMPTCTRVTFIDNTGSERIAIRQRGQSPVDNAGAPIRLRMADLGQDESGRLARGYKDEPEILLEFLDEFIVRHEFEEQETELLAQLEENGAEIRRTAGIQRQLQELEEEHAMLKGRLQAATVGRVEDIAQWATLLAAQKPMLAELAARLAEAATVPTAEPLASLDVLAAEFNVDLTKKPASEFVDELRTALAGFDAKRGAIVARTNSDLAVVAEDIRASLNQWTERHADLERRLDAKERELQAQGLKVQAGAVRTIASRLRDVTTRVTALRKKRDEHTRARDARSALVNQLHTNRELLFQARQATLKRIAKAANSFADDLTIRVYFDRCGINDEWERWLTTKYGFKRPRVTRLAHLIGPKEFATKALSERESLLALEDTDGTAFFSEEIGVGKISWSEIFAIQTMRREDRPRIEVQRRGNPEPQPFDQLSAGQQRSVLLSLLLCAERSEPLILDQPEDHLDGQYIANAVVRHLEAAKERRQIMIATHSANLAVLGDAELVVPLKVVDGLGCPYAVGAVDRPETRDEVCALLEGGAQAYKKRGERYGFTFA